MKKLLIFVLPLLFSVLCFSQTREQQAKIAKTVNQSDLLKLKTKFQAAYEKSETEVANYLAANPTVQRTFTKNGSLYFLKRIASDGTPIFINTKSNIGSGELIKANELYSGGSIGANITGTDMVAGVWDGGQVLETHELLNGKVEMQAGQSLNEPDGNSHQTHVSGTIVGKDLGSSHPNYSARGIAYDAKTQNYDWNNDLTEMATFGSQFLISNHSYGPSNGPELPQWFFGAYDSTANEWDALLKTTPKYLPFVAGGNEQMNNGSGKTGTSQGYDVMTSAAAAKNTMVVGAVNADKTMSEYSNFGPTDDGRVKPDIVTRGTGINSAQASADDAYSGDGDDSSGTSYASPAAAAGALLLQQYYFSLNNEYMDASMLKALILHTADDLGPEGPDMKFGWGLMNIERAAQVIKDAKFTGKARMHTFTINPQNDSNSEISITGNGSGSVPNSGTADGELKASMCWTDDEGTIQQPSEGVDPTASRLVYNFDMLLRRFDNFDQTWPFQQFTMATRTNVASLGNNWFQNNADAYRQAIIPTGNSEGDRWTLYVRKESGSPAAVRNISVIVTGLAESVLSLSTNDIDKVSSKVFFNATDNTLRLISNSNIGFGKYAIYDINGRVVQNGTTDTRNISFQNRSTGIYIIKFENENGSESLKFMKK